MPRPGDPGVVHKVITIPPIKSQSRGGQVLNRPPGKGQVIYQAPHDGRNAPEYFPHDSTGRGNAKLARGQIWVPTRSAIPGSKRKGRLGLSFLYNPSQVEHDNSVQFEVLPPAVQQNGTGGKGGAAALTPGSATVEFDLILDRTYEVWQDPSNPGVLEDVRQLEAMIGYTPASPFMQATGIYVAFGNVANTLGAGRNNVLWYYGWLTNYSVIYTNWTQYMVPYRAALSGLTLQVIARSQANAVAGNQATVDASDGTADDTGTVVDGGSD